MPSCSCYSDDCRHDDPDWEDATGACEFCEGPIDENGGCPCNPCLTEEYIPVRASFEITDGKVVEL